MKKTLLALAFLFSVISYSQTPTGTTAAGKFKAHIATKDNSATRVVVQDSISKEYRWVLKSSLVGVSSSDVLEYANFVAFPATGTIAKIYVDKATNILYRWSGSAYVILSPFTTPNFQQVTNASLNAGYAETTHGISVGGIKVGNFYADGYSFGISDSFDANYNLSWMPYTGGLLLDDFAGNTSMLGYGNIQLNGYNVLTTQNIDIVPTNGSSNPAGSDGTFDALALKATTAYVDAKVQNSLAASTTIAPSATAVNTALATKEPTIAAGIAGQYWDGTKTWQTLPTSTVLTLQQVLDNNHDLTNGTVKIGTSAGDSSTGINKVAIGQSAASGSSGINQVTIGKDVGINNSGGYTTAIVGGLNNNTKDDAIGIGNGAGSSNTGDNFIGLGYGAGLNNTYNNVKLFGKNAIATENGQIVFSKNGTIMARFDTSLMSSSQQYGLPNDSGTFALLNSPTFTGTPNAPTQSPNDNTTKIATTAYVDAKVQNSTSASTTIAPSATAVNTALNLKLNTSDFINPTLTAYGLLGSSLKSHSLSVPGYPTSITNSAALVSTTMRFSAVYLEKGQTITGVSFWQANAGVYTANNYNGVGLYTHSAGILTLVASSTDDGNIWKSPNLTWVSKPFSSTYVAAKGLYYIGALYSTSAQTTAPSIGAGTAVVAGLVALDFTNSGRINATLINQTLLPSTQSLGTTAVNGTNFGFWLY